MPLTKFVGRFDNSCLEDLAEFRKRYENTHLFVHLPTGKELAYVSNVGDSLVHLETINYGTLLVQQETDIEFEVEWPETGLFQLDHCMMWGSRVPDRQWKRGVYSKNYHMFDPCRRLFTPAGLLSANVGLKTLESAYKVVNPKPLSEAVHELISKQFVSLAISRDWGLSWSPIADNKCLLLWRGARPVAEIAPKSKQISVHFQPLEQEVKDFVRDNREPVWQIV